MAETRWQRVQQVLARLGVPVQEGVALAPFTSARIGGPARLLVTLIHPDHWAPLMQVLWEEAVPHVLLGGGSNMLVSDEGVLGVVVRNRVRGVRWLCQGEEALLWAASGEPLTPLARMTVDAGYRGLEWAVGIPGTVGGAVVGNAGAFGGDIAGVLVEAELLHRDLGRVTWTPQDLAMDYRFSRLKDGLPAVVLGAVFRLRRDDPERLRRDVEAYQAHRRRTQPPGASMGSMFKNPPGDYAGRLIEAVGLKGTRIGDAEISPLHANFFINRGRAQARDVLLLMRLAQKRVYERFGIWLEPEIVLVGVGMKEAQTLLAGARG